MRPSVLAMVAVILSFPASILAATRATFQDTVRSENGVSWRVATAVHPDLKTAIAAIGKTKPDCIASEPFGEIKAVIVVTVSRADGLPARWKGPPNHFETQTWRRIETGSAPHGHGGPDYTVTWIPRRDVPSDRYVAVIAVHYEPSLVETGVSYRQIRAGHADMIGGPGRAQRNTADRK